MNNLKKYNKYKLKYLQLKNQMKGGKPTGPPHKVDILLTLKNNGSRPEEPYLCEQCMWISIRDFLEYHRGINMSVRKLKASVDLGPETDKTEFDHDFGTRSTNKLYDGLIALCKKYKITLVLITISPQRTVYPGYIVNGVLSNHDRINDDDDHPDNEEVYIASFGRHFELIVKGPGYTLESYTEQVKPSREASASSMTQLQATPYEPKVKVSENCKATFVPIDELSPAELRVASYQIELIGLKQELEFFTTELKRVNTELGSYRNASADLKKLKLDTNTEEILNASNIKFIQELTIQKQQIESNITRINGLIKTKEKELSENTNDEQSKARKTIETNKGSIALLEADIKRYEQHIKDLNASKTSIDSIGLNSEQKSQFIKQSDEAIAKYNIDISKIHKQIEKLTDENQTLQLLVN